MAVVLLQPLVFLLQPPKAAPVVPPAPASRGRLCCRGGLTAPYYSHRWPGPAATTASHRSRTSEPSYSSPRGLPLPRLPRLRVAPFLGLVVVPFLGALAAAWLTWSRNDFHRKSTVRGEAAAGSTATAQFFVICQVSRFVRPVGLQIFQEEESFHSAGRENGPSVMRNGLYIFKTHQTCN